SLLGMINDLLDFSKIEAGKLELYPAHFSFRAALGDTLRALAVPARPKGLEFDCQVQPHVPDAFLGDARRPRQVLLNLVGNAVKFTDQGEVGVHVQRDDERGMGEKDSASSLMPHLSSLTLRFTIRDTGIGIPKPEHERIFRAFEQEDSATTRR